jgi:replicative DNA helicase
METNLEHLIVNKLFTDDSYMRKVIPFLQVEYFTSPYKELFRVFVDHVATYNKIPDKASFGVTLEQSRVNLSVQDAAVRDLVNEMFTAKELDDAWLSNNTEKWCQEKALYNAIMKSIQVIDGKDPHLKKDALPDILQTALSVSFDTNIGHDYIQNAEDRYEFYHKVEEKIPFDLEYFNRITKDGIANKSLTVVLASTGVGKSLFMCHMAANAVSQGRNVLYITLEMAEERIAERIDANLFDLEIDQIENLPKDVYLNKVNQIAAKSHGNLIIKEYPTSQAHTGHFRALLRELKLKKRFEPEMVFVDYINICASSRMKMGGSINSYTYIKAIAEEMRGLAMEFDIPIITATQINREGSKSSDPALEDTSECIYVNEEIELRDGTKKLIGDVKLGDQIKANDDYKTVMMVHHKKMKQCYKIKLKSGKEIIVSEDHVFPTDKGRISIKTGLKSGVKLNTKN